MLIYPAIELRQLEDTLMQIRIISHPHTSEEDSREFVQSLLDQRAIYRGDLDTAPQLDKAALEKLREALGKGPAQRKT